MFIVMGTRTRQTSIKIVGCLASLSFLVSCEAVDRWLTFSRDKLANTVEAPTAPVAPSTALQSIDDESISVSTSGTTSFTWAPATTLAAGDTYEVAVGTTSGGTDVVPWTSVGTATTWSGTGLVLTLNNTYYGSVRIKNSLGTVTSTLNADGWKVVATVSSIARYSIAPNWNDYALTATPASACVGNENGYYMCIHGGEQRRVNYAAAANCTGYVITDELGAFDWACDQTGGAGNVFFYTRGLKKSKGLADLLNATSWKTNRVVITSSGTPVAASARTAWWTNTVAALPASPTAGSPVSLASGIYTVSSNMTVTGGYTYTGTKVGVVTLGSAIVTLASGANSDTPIFTGNIFGKFSWLEGEFVSALASGLVYDSLGNHSVVRRLRSTGFKYGIGDASIAMNSSWVSQVYTTRTSDAGIRVKGGYNTYQDIVTVGNTTYGVQIGDVSDNNVFQSILTANNGSSGLYIYSTTNCNLLGITSVNSSVGSFLITTSTGTTYHNIFMKNSTGFTMMMGLRETVGQAVLASINLAAQDTSKFTGNLIVPTATSCGVGGGTNPGLVNSTCANQGSSNAAKTISATKGDLSFVGQISATDAVNSTNTNGTAAFSAALDWVHFSNSLRGWGKGGAFPNAATQGPCTSGTCQIWDFTLKPSDADLKNVTVDGSTQNAAFVNGAACPAHLGGNITTVNINSTPRTYLTHAMEIQGTGGNNNGLCESNESCLYMPNFGAYQGSGDFWSNTCTFSNGTVTGVKMYAYPVN